MKNFTKISFFIILFSSISIFAQNTFVDSLNFNIIRTTEEKYKVSVAIIVDQYSCEVCIGHINPLYKTKFKNIEINMKIYFHSDNKQIMDKIVKENGWQAEVIQDPIGLYAKHFNVAIYPAIVILDEDNNQLYNNYLGNVLYLKVLHKIDSLAEKITPKINEGYKITRTITLIKNNEKYITDQLQVCYDFYKNNYWLIDVKNKSILMFDSVGKYYKEVQFPYKEHFKYFYPWDINLLNDSIIYFVDWPLAGGNYFIKMNINTGDTISVFNLDTYKNKRNDTAGFSVNMYCYNKLNNNIIFHYNTGKPIEMQAGTPLLLLVDLNTNSFNQFAPVTQRLSKSDSRCGLSAVETFINYADNTINNIRGNTKILNIFDEKGNHIKDIDLDFSNNFKHSYQIDLEMGEKYMNQINEYRNSVSFIDIIDIINDTIYVFYYNNYGPELKECYYENLT